MGQEYIDPPQDVKRRLVVVWSIAIVVWLLLLLLSTQIEPFRAYVSALPLCEQIPWWRGVVIVASGLFLAIGVIPLVILAKLARYRQFPFPGSVVWRRTKVQRGPAFLGLSAFVLLALCVGVVYILGIISTSSIVEGLFFHDCDGA